MDNWLPVVLALVATIPGILAYLNQRVKVPAESADLVSGAAKKLLDSLSGRLDVVTERMDSLEVQLRKARDDLDIAEANLAKARTQLESVEQANVRLRSAAGLMLDGIRKLVAQLTAIGVAPAWHPSEALIADLNGIGAK